MKIMIIGAGVIGVTSAWYLAQDGHDVTVIDSHPEIAMGASYGNGGQLSVGHSAPWATPGLFKTVMTSLWKKDSAIKYRPDYSLHQIGWLMEMLEECTHERFTINQARMLKLAAYSRDCRHALQESTGIDFEGRRGGILQIYSTEESFTAAHKQATGLKALGLDEGDILSIEEVISVEPGLAHAPTPPVGGLRLADEECGDSTLFSRRLAEMAKAKGVQFHLNEKVLKIETNADEITAIQTDKDRYTADCYIVAAGYQSYQLLYGLQKNVRVYPIKGYAITADIKEVSLAPQYALLDISRNIAITRFAEHVRIVGYAEVVGSDAKLDPVRHKQLKDCMEGWFPGSVDTENAEFWAGFRPSTPDGTPIIGQGRLKNLYLNTGHGTMGWTLSCGSSRLLADLISGKTPELNPADYNIARY
jgi:D-amino-acid dehydrogenase